MAGKPPPCRATSRPMAGVLGGLTAACAAGGYGLGELMDSDASESRHPKILFAELDIHNSERTGAGAGKAKGWEC